jgi:hypothetical protein
MYTLPLPRYKWYEESDYDKIRSNVVAITGPIIERLGFYDVRTSMSLLKILALSAVANILLGLLFSIIVMLFIVISILLIYSLLMISVETKTFESGVMRLLGISKWNVITMIMIQSLLFVVPSIIVGYCLSIPALLEIFKAMFKGTFDLTPVPSANATI